MKNMHHDRAATCETLLRLPNYRLDLEKIWDDKRSARYAFTVYPNTNADQKGVSLLSGNGHAVTRRDIHHALYLFQCFHLQDASSKCMMRA